MSGPVLLSFLPVFTTVASWIMFISLTSLVHPHLDYYITFPAECLLPGWQSLASCLRSGRMPIVVLMMPQTLAFLSCSVSANITLLQKCDGSGLSFCLKLIELCPPTSAPWLLVFSYYKYNLILPHTPSVQYSIFCYSWIACSKFHAVEPWDCGFIKWQFF
jgi:hypothetical protein